VRVMLLYSPEASEKSSITISGVMSYDKRVNTDRQLSKVMKFETVS